MRGLNQLGSVRVISVGHAFIQKVRRGHYEQVTDIKIVGIGSRLRSPGWRSPSDLAQSTVTRAPCSSKQPCRVCMSVC